MIPEDKTTAVDGDNWYFHRTWSDFRRGSKSVRVLFDGREASASLYDEGVPEMSAALLAHLPLIIPVVHVAWSGEMVMSARPFPIGPTKAENSVRLPRPGDFTWDPKFCELCFAYGTAEARLPSGENQLVVFGSIDRDLEAFAAFCRARRFEGLGTIELAAT